MSTACHYCLHALPGGVVCQVTRGGACANAALLWREVRRIEDQLTSRPCRLSVEEASIPLRQQ